MRLFLLILLLSCSIIRGATTNLLSPVISSNTFKVFTNYTTTNFTSITTNLISLGYLKPSANVMDFGAIPDGLTDNTVAISNAWKSLPSSGGTVFFPNLSNGVYLSRALILVSPIKNNVTFDSRRVEIRPVGTNSSYMLALRGTNHTIKNLVFNGNFTSPWGIYHDTDANTVNYDNVVIENLYSDSAIDPAGTGGVLGVDFAAGIHNVNFHNSIISNLTFSSVGNVARFCKGLFGGSTSTNASLYGSKIQVSNSRFYKVLGDGQTEGDCISFQMLNNATNTAFLGSMIQITGNLFDGYTRRGVKGYSDVMLISDNTFITDVSNAYQYGAVSAFANKITINNNVVFAPFYHGFEALTAGGAYAYATNVLISNNQLFSTAIPGEPSTGIHIEGSTNVLVLGNIISGATTNGIQIFGPNENINIRNNQVRSYNYGIILNTNGVVVSTPNNVTIANNTINSANYAIYPAFGGDITVENNRGAGTTAFIYSGGTVTTFRRFNNGLIPPITTATLDFGSISSLTSADLTITVTGAATGDPVNLSLPASPTSGIAFNAWVSAANTVTIRAHNYTGSPIDPVSASYTVAVVKN